MKRRQVGNIIQTDGGEYEINLYSWLTFASRATGSSLPKDDLSEIVMHPSSPTQFQA